MRCMILLPIWLVAVLATPEGVDGENHSHYDNCTDNYRRHNHGKGERIILDPPTNFASYEELFKRMIKVAAQHEGKGYLRITYKPTHISSKDNSGNHDLGNLVFTYVGDENRNSDADPRYNLVQRMIDMAGDKEGNIKMVYLPARINNANNRGDHNLGNLIFNYYSEEHFTGPTMMTTLSG